MSRIGTASLVCLLAFVAPSAPAAEGAHPIDQLNSLILTQCKSMEQQFRDTDEYRNVLAKVPEGTMCNCVTDRLKASPAIVALRAEDADVVTRRLALESQFTDYLVAKMSSEIFSCLAKDLDTGADALNAAH